MHWILVTGTGKQHNLPDNVFLLARAVGQDLAEKGLGLVVGGWPGVDYIVAQAFAEVLKEQRKALSDNMIQVVADRRPVIYPESANYPDFRGGYIITVPSGVREWVEAIKYADAVILIGGEGGTYDTFQYATQEQRPIFPLACTGGDAELVFKEVAKHWELYPYASFTKQQFIEILSQPVETERDAKECLQRVINLIQAQLNGNYSNQGQNRDFIFVSYAHEDRAWLVKLRYALRPLERNTNLLVWDDLTLSPGDEFLQKITKIVDKAVIAILIVSDSYLQSEFIREYELPKVLELNRTGKLKLFWLLTSGHLYKNSPLASVLALNNFEEPLESMPPAQQQDVLIMLRNKISILINNR